MASTFINLPTVKVKLKSDADISIDNLPVGTVGATDTLSMVTSGTEYSFTFPVNLKWFKIRSRRRGTLSLGYTAGNRNWSIMPGNRENVEHLSIGTALTIYVSSTKNSDTLEIHYWV